ncbi:MAG: putative glycolipid-binding domain-containing protein [Chloroflexi bacterium]|nr:putative glycolipid-binding domain-containing protein [Chloroflexota bacterium]
MTNQGPNPIHNPIQNPQSKIQNRKGVYQAFDADGSVTADERWQFIETLDSGIRIDTDTARIAPFVEPRTESLTFELSPTFALRSLALHAYNNRRESRAGFSDDRANFCWRLDDVSRNREFDWRSDCEIGYNSPLFNMVTLWRSHLQPGQSRTFDVVLIDHVTFEPRWMRQVYTYVGDEQHDTRFGPMPVAHYAVSTVRTRSSDGDFWCDRAGVVFDFMASDGAGFRLVAVNFPS